MGVIIPKTGTNFNIIGIDWEFREACLIFLEYALLVRYNPKPLAHAIIPRQVIYQETDGEGVTHIVGVVDIAGAVLADSAAGTSFVADCMAIVDSVSYRGYCGGGVSFAY